MQKRWHLHPFSFEESQKLANILDLHPLLAQILIQRGYPNPESALSFLSSELKGLADPFEIRDMPQAVSRLRQALDRNESIVIYGDYDVDGTTGSTLLYLFLKELGAKVSVYIPHRLKEGYGLNFNALRTIKGQGAELVITVDNGISSIEEAKEARSLGLDLIIVDHHHVPPELPFAVAVLNPKRPDCSYPYRELSGVGLAFQLALALRKILRDDGFFENRSIPNLKQHLDLVTLGTIADLVPLTGQNRILVKNGLSVLSESRKVGIHALKEVSGVHGSVNPGQVGFRLGPRINAAGRLESAKLGFDLLSTHDQTIAKNLAQRLDLANSERQQIEEQIVEEAVIQVEKDVLPKGFRSIVVASKNWHPGVIGIVASRLVERYHLPAIVGSLYQGTWKGSARSIRGLDLYEVLSECGSYLEKFGGHRFAAGLTMDPSHQQIFADHFDRAVRFRLKEEDFVPVLFIDGVLDAASLNLKFWEDIQRLGPFGQGNPEPVFLAKEVKIVSQKTVGDKHAKFAFKIFDKVIEGIGFGMADWQPELSGTAFDCVFNCDLNEWNGVKRLQLKLVDVPRRHDKKNIYGAS